MEHVRAGQPLVAAPDRLLADDAVFLAQRRPAHTLRLVRLRDRNGLAADGSRRWRRYCHAYDLAGHGPCRNRHINRAAVGDPDLDVHARTRVRRHLDLHDLLLRMHNGGNDGNHL